MSSAGRLIQGLYLVLVGLAFAVRGVIALQGPDFWDARTDLDYAAVWTHSLALLLAAPALIILVGQARAGRVATWLAWIMAVGAVLSAVANAVEDGLHRPEFGTLYVLGALPFAYGMILLAVLLARGPRPAFAVVPGLTFVGGLAYDAGGGILIGATWAVFGLAVATGRTGPSTEDDATVPVDA